MQPVLRPALGNRGLSWNSRHLLLGPASPTASPPGVPFPSLPPGPSQTPRLGTEPPHLPLDTVSRQQPAVGLRSLPSAAACGLLTASSAPLTRCLSFLEFSAISEFFFCQIKASTHAWYTAPLSAQEPVRAAGWPQALGQRWRHRHPANARGKRSCQEDGEEGLYVSSLGMPDFGGSGANHVSPVPTYAQHSCLTPGLAVLSGECKAWSSGVSGLPTLLHPPEKADSPGPPSQGGLPHAPCRHAAPSHAGLGVCPHWVESSLGACSLLQTEPPSWPSTESGRQQEPQGC